MTIKYLKKAPKTASTDDTKTKDIVQNLLRELEKSREEGCKELTKKFDKYDGEIVVSKEKIEELNKNLDQKTKTILNFPTTEFVNLQRPNLQIMEQILKLNYQKVCMPVKN